MFVRLPHCSKLMDMAGSLTDEAQLVTALAQNDALTTAMARYDELLARASAEPTVLPPSGEYVTTTTTRQRWPL
jgi:hypothetical protein